jgi:hypothetical protein
VRRIARSCKQKRRISSRPRAPNDRPPSPSWQEVPEDLPPPLYSPKYLEVDALPEVQLRVAERRIVRRVMSSSCSQLSPVKE